MKTVLAVLALVSTVVPTVRATNRFVIVDGVIKAGNSEDGSVKSEFSGGRQPSIVIETPRKVPEQAPALLGEGRPLQQLMDEMEQLCVALHRQ